MKKLAILALLLCCLAMKGQTSSVTATLTDTDGTLWVNGNCTVTLQWSTTKYPTTTPYRVDIGPGTLVPQHPGCTVDGSGVLHVTVTDVKFIYPPNSTWLFTVCPNVYQGNLGCGVTQVPVTGATVNLTGTLKVPAARVGGGIGAFAYADLEVAPLFNNFYWNTTSAKCRTFTTAWGDCGGGGGGLPGGTGLVKVVGGIGELASPGNDYIEPNSFNGMNPQGTAVTGTNYSSNSMWFQGNYCTGSSPCAPGGDFWSIQNVLGTGVNPSSTLTLAHSGTSGPASIAGVTPPIGDSSNRIPTTTWVFSNISSVPAQFFGAYGDAYGPTNGCITTASNTTVQCPDNTFLPTDVGKQFWEKGAGVGGVAFNATITNYVDAGHVVVSAAPSISVSNAPQNAVYGHDDVAAVQACWQYSANNNVQCTLRALPIPSAGGFTGFLIGSAGLQLVPGNNSSGMSTTGNNAINGTNLFCEFNGDCISLAAGPIQGAVVSNLVLQGDSTQPNGRGIHLNATAGAFGVGGLWFSTLTNVAVNNFNQECLLSEGGNYLSSGQLPNQVDSFINFNCNAPIQMHTANLIKMTGQHAQIIFMQGQTNGPGPESNQPNAMILLTEQNAGHADAATDTKFFGYTYEGGTIGLQLGSGAYNVHYDNGYVEVVAQPLIAGGTNGVYGLTYNGNHIANSGNTTAVAQFTGNVTGSMRDALIYGGSDPAAALAVCTGGTNSVSFSNNAVLSGSGSTSSCATTSASVSGTSLTVNGGSSATVGANATPMTTVSAPLINSGNTLTLIATGNFSLATGGNINLGGLTSPLAVPAGSTVTLTLMDSGTTWTVTGNTIPLSAASIPACAPPTVTYRWISAQACSTSSPCQTDQASGNNASQTTSGDLPAYNPVGGPADGPSLAFNGTTDYTVPTTPIPATTDLTIYAIFKTASAPSGTAYPFTGGASNSINFGVSSSNQVFLNQDDVVGVHGTRTYTPGTWYAEVVTYHNATTTANFYAITGGTLTPDGTSTSQALSFSGATPNLGGAFSDSQFFNGPIAEIGYANSVLNTAGLSSIVNWGSCHYGIQ